MAPAIATTALTTRYGRSRGIEELTMTVERGEIFGFLGPNGAGKTTTIRTLLDLLHPTSGRAQLLGLDSRRDSVAIHARAGYLPGDFAAEGDLRGRELLDLSARLRGLPGIGAAPALAERFGAELDRPLRELSRGNRQKVGLLLAMAHRPELLIFDEPTAGLDPLVQEAFLLAVREARDRGATVFLSSHNLTEVERVCDRVGIVRAGRLAAVEAVDELTGKAFRRVSITFADPVSPEVFGRLPGVEQLSADGTVIRFRLRGDLDRVVKAAAAHRVLDMQLERPSLEEMFLTFYAEPNGS